MEGPDDSPGSAREPRSWRVRIPHANSRTVSRLIQCLIFIGTRVFTLRLPRFEIVPRLVVCEPDAIPQ